MFSDGRTNKGGKYWSGGETLLVCTKTSLNYVEICNFHVIGIERFDFTSKFASIKVIWL